MELWDSKKKKKLERLEVSSAKKKGWDVVHLGKGNQKDEMLSKKKTWL